MKLRVPTKQSGIFVSDKKLRIKINLLFPAFPCSILPLYSFMSEGSLLGCQLCYDMQATLTGEWTKQCKVHCVFRAG